MRFFKGALSWLVLMGVVGCSAPAAEIASVTAIPTIAAKTEAVSEIPVARLTPSRTPAAAVTRTPAPSRTPVAAPTLAARRDGLPIPPDARETRAIPNELRTFIQGQLKGLTRVGQPTAYVTPHPRDEILNQYEQDLKDGGWDTVPLGSSLSPQYKLIVAQNSQIRAIIAFMTEDSGDTLVHITTITR